MSFNNVLIAATFASVAMGVPLAAAVPAAVTTATDPESASVASGEGRAVATKLADELLSSFVYREQAERYAAMLRKNAAAGRYDQGSRGAIAKLINDDLMAVQRDGHLAVHVTRPEDRGPNGGPSGLPPLIQSARELAPGIAYIRFSAFFATDEELAGVRKFLDEHRDANRDLRPAQPSWRRARGAGPHLLGDLRQAHAAGEAHDGQVHLRPAWLAVRQSEDRAVRDRG
jgi:hypothetical protein